MRHLPSLHQRGQLSQSQDIEYVLVEGSGDAPEQTFKDYLNTIRKRKWLVCLPACMILPLVVMALIVQKPKYQATATLLLEKTNPNILSIKEVITPESSPDFYQTQIEIIKSRDIAEQVVDRLQFYKKEPEADPHYVQVIKDVQAFPGKMMHKAIDKIKQVLVPPLPASSDKSVETPQDWEAQRRFQAIEDLKWSLDVKPRGQTQVVDVTLEGDDPDEVTQQVNMVAEIYVKQNLENKLDASRKAIAWLKKESSSLKEKIHREELALQEFREKKNILDPGTYGSDDNSFQQFLFSNIDNIQTKLDETRIERQALENKIQDLEGLYNNSIDEIIRNRSYMTSPIVKILAEKYLQLEIEREFLLKSYREGHPKIVRINRQIKDTQEMLVNETKKEVQGEIFKLKKDLRLLLENESTLVSELNAKKGAFVGSGNEMDRYNELKRELEIDKDLYLNMSKRLAETTLTEALETNNIKTLEQALYGLPVSSGRLIKLVLGLMASLGLGVGLALLVDHLSKKFKSVDEVERSLGVPFLGFIPHYRSRHHGPIVLYEPNSLPAEAYRSIRTWLETSAPTQLKPLMVTSAMVGEGKSTTSANLAVSFAQLGRLVIVVDVDLRRPTLHRYFGVSNAGGLVNILVQDKAWEAVLKSTPLENLKVLTAGGTPVNPSELLSTNRMKDLIIKLRDTFDIVIFDAPVALGIPDVTILSRHTEGVMLVHNPHSSDKEATFAAKKVLDRARAGVVGVLFNNIRARDQYDYHHSYSYYGSAYSSREQPRPPAVPQIDMRPAEHRHKWETD